MADISVGDVGIILSFGSQTINLTGATCTLTIISPTGTRQSVPMVIGSTSFEDPNTGIVYAIDYWCYRATQSTDFTMAGKYQIQPVLNLAGGIIKKIDIMYISVGEAL